MEEQKDVQKEGNEKKSKREAIMQGIFLILLIIAIATMISAIITIHKYAAMLLNPMGYNMDKFGLTYCSCYNQAGELVPIRSKLFNDSLKYLYPKQEVIPINYSLNFN